MDIRRLGAALLLVLPAAMLPTAAQAAPGLPSTSDWVTTWVNVNSRRCLEIADSQQWNGARAQQWDCVGIATQSWVMHPTVDGYEIRNLNSGKCLEIADSQPWNGARAQQWDCVGIATQRWLLRYWGGEAGYRLINKNSGKCIEVADSLPHNGARVQQWDCVPGVRTQQWL